MTFEKIITDTSCSCLSDAIQNTASVFARVLNKDEVSDKDFVSKWDKENIFVDGKIIDKNQLTDCEIICGLKGISVSKIENEAVKNEIITIYSQMFKLSPKYKKGVLIFKFNNNAGLVKPTPDDQNKYHHDFYKSDAFTLLSISATETIILSPPAIV